MPPVKTADDALGDRRRLARQQRLVDLEPVSVQHTRVGGDTVALTDPQEIARDDLAGRDGALTAVPNDRGDALERGAQSEDSTLRAQLLREAERGVEDDDEPDRRGFDRLADRGRDERRRDEQPHERLDQLASGNAPVGGAAGAVELVRPILLEAGRGLGGVEATRRIRAELESDTARDRGRTPAAGSSRAQGDHHLFRRETRTARRLLRRRSPGTR